MNSLVIVTHFSKLIQFFDLLNIQFFPELSENN
jgi:hypothetical protein